MRIVGRRGEGKKIAAGLLSVGLLAACAASPPIPPPAATAAPATASAGLDPKVAPLMVSACYPCHSDQRRDPWFAKIAPSSWWTKGARKTLNFSAWSHYDVATRAVEIQMIADSVRKGTMPPADYTFFNHGARLNDEQRRVVLAWAAVQAAEAH